ncbi:V-type ATP synthase subunit I [Folsomia candida]|uniref:V-type ATP synthase subunit I n=1 Tax=Folsomia candida TaxID=158441 RepID=A0A226DHS9_FOLCA|nr:V-type ATP synthase subunit I [Folsomia candida]
MISMKMANHYNPVQDMMAAAICQKLFESTPNLQEVEVQARFYLDFAPSKKLAKLNYMFVQVFDWDAEENPRFMEMDKMVKMLESCRESVTELSLSLVGDDVDDEEVFDDIPQTLFLPSFTSLTRLSIFSLKAYRWGDCLSETNLPNLTHVKLAGCMQQGFILSDIFAPLLQTHVGITSLDLEAVYDGDEDNVGIGTDIVRLFPSVKMLQLKLTVLEEVEDYEDVHLLKQTLRNFAPWKLTWAFVQVANMENMDEFEEFIDENDLRISLE